MRKCRISFRADLLLLAFLLASAHVGIEAWAETESWGDFKSRSVYGAFHPYSLYYTGELFSFSEKPMQLLHQDDNQRALVVSAQGGGELFGIGFQWLKPLETGYQYEFHLTFLYCPDFIVMDDSVVWERTQSSSWKPGEPNEIAFQYVPAANSSGMIWCICDSTKEGSERRIQFASHPSFRCFRSPVEKAPVPDYAIFRIPYEIHQSEKLFTLFDQDFRVPVEWNRPPLRKPAYPTEDFVILDYAGLIQDDGPAKTQFLGRSGVPHAYCRLLAENGVRGMILRGCILPASPEATLEADKEIISRGLDTFYIDVPDRGRWLEAKMNPGFHNWGYGKTPEDISQLEQWRTAQYLQDSFPECRLLLLVGGELEDAQYLAYPPVEHHFDLIQKGFIDIHREWNEVLRKQLRFPERVPLFQQSSGAAYSMAYLLKSYDMAQSKNWGRQNMEVNLANNRGATRAYGRPMMIADDPWVSELWCTRSVEEMEQVFYLSYFSGADYLYQEYSLFLTQNDRILPNRWGAAYLDFSRFAASHPKRGKQIVRLAVMRGFGDTWGKIYMQDCPSGWGYHKNRPIGDTSLRDYDLLQVFFPRYGNHYQTGPNRFCTGTPYGPADLIPWDTPVEQLEGYDLVVFMGRNGMDAAQYQNLMTYVNRGGTLVLSLGQLRVPGPDPRQVIQADHESFLGVRLDPLPKREEGPFELDLMLDGEVIPARAGHFYRVDRTTAQTLGQVTDSSPVLLSHPFGMGKVFLYATDYLTEVSGEWNTRFLSQLAESRRDVSFDPPSDWLEYTLHKKGDSYILALFNHGQIGFPSGNGPMAGIWSGTVSLVEDGFAPLEGVGLEAFIVDFPQSADGKAPDLQPIPFKMTEGRIEVEVAVDRWKEVLIGPVERARDDFRYGR